MQGAEAVGEGHIDLVQSLDEIVNIGPVDVVMRIGGYMVLSLHHHTHPIANSSNNSTTVKLLY